MKPPTKASGVTRRQFVATTATVGAALSGGRLLARTTRPGAAQDTGRKGKVYPDQRRKFTDPRSGYTIWQLTNAGAPPSSCISDRSMTPDSRWLIYLWIAAAAAINLFKMDLPAKHSYESGAVISTGDLVDQTGITADTSLSAPSIGLADRRTLCVRRSSTPSCVHDRA
jgi:hypothetical protein